MTGLYIFVAIMALVVVAHYFGLMRDYADEDYGVANSIEGWGDPQKIKHLYIKLENMPASEYRKLTKEDLQRLYDEG